MTGVWHLAAWAPPAARRCTCTSSKILHCACRPQTRCGFRDMARSMRLLTRVDACSMESHTKERSNLLYHTQRHQRVSGECWMCSQRALCSVMGGGSYTDVVVQGTCPSKHATGTRYLIGVSSISKSDQRPATASSGRDAKRKGLQIITYVASTQRPWQTLYISEYIH